VVVSAGPDEGLHVEELLPLYYLDELNADDRWTVLVHLAWCADCRRTAAGVCEALAALALVATEDVR
jgi:hypothetical protein